MNTDITKQLAQIVQSLTQIISASKQTSLTPQTPKLKKTSDMTYHDFLKKVLAGKDAVPVPSKKMSYRLQQDLVLLLELSEHNQISMKTFEAIVASKKINRTVQSLKSRYHDYLYKIQEKEMKKIVNWIQEQGLDGYLYFEGDNLMITKTEPKDLLKQKQKQQAEAKKARPTSLDKQTKKVQKTTKKLLTNIPSNCKQLNQVLRIYSKMVGVPIKTLVQKLDQLSGDLVELDNYIETRDNRLLWTAEQDEILERGGPELEILKKYRGQAVEVRRKYLGLA